MARQSLLILFSVGLSLELVLTTILPTQAQLSPANSGQTLSTSSLVSVTFDPPGRGKPRDTAGGASRDGGVCPQDSNATGSSVTLLSPATYDGLTWEEYPTLLVYVPQTSAQKAVFVVKDETEDYYYQKTIPIPRTAGIFSIKLPADAPPIEIGKNYTWSFVMICGEAISPNSPRVEGQIQRVEANPNLSAQMKNLSPLERAALYGKNGVWYDTIASLAEQRRSQPNDATVSASWENLLISVGLEAIATKPLLQ